jgi:hypothetical protein
MKSGVLSNSLFLNLSFESCFKRLSFKLLSYSKIFSFLSHGRRSYDVGKYYYFKKKLLNISLLYKWIMKS